LAGETAAKRQLSLTRLNVPLPVPAKIDRLAPVHGERRDRMDLIAI
jgi:hypothetical protein